MRQFGKYQLVRSLAVGGMGEVFLAVQQGPGGFARTVVLKVILKHLANDLAFVEQFLNEGRLAALLTHPNIVQVLELGELDGGYFLAMEYLHGRTLRATLNEYQARGTRFPAGLGAWALAQALHGLHYAHELRNSSGNRIGVVHRDVSPDNLMLGFAGGVKLLDFGIARAMGVVSTTRPGTVKGKLPYLAPEVLQGMPANTGSDLYSVGIMLFELVTGKRPFSATSDLEYIARITTEEPPALIDLAPDAPPELAAITARALARRPEDRFANAGEMADALERFAASTGEPLGQAALARELKALHGDVAAETPTSARQIPDLAPSLTQTVERPREPTAEAQTTPVQAPRRRLLSPIVLAAFVLLGVTLAWFGWLNSPTSRRTTMPSRQEVDSGFVKADAAVEVEDAGASPPVEPETLTARPEPSPVRRAGTVLLQVRPWAEVSLRGRSLGVTPMDPITLPAGVHTFLLKNPTLKVERRVSVKVRAGGQVVVRVVLE